MENTTSKLASRARAFVSNAKSTLMRELAELLKTLTSRTFLFFVLAPLGVWVCLMLWFRVPLSEWLSSLALVLFVWTFAPAMWLPVAMGLGRHRHAATVFLAPSVLTTVRACMQPSKAAHAHSGDELPVRLGD